MWTLRSTTLALSIVFVKAAIALRSEVFTEERNIIQYCNRWTKENRQSLTSCSCMCAMDQDCQGIVLNETSYTCDGLVRCQTWESGMSHPHTNIYKKKNIATLCLSCPESYNCQTVDGMTLCTKHYSSDYDNNNYFHYREKCVLDGALPVRIDTAAKQAVVEKILGLVSRIPVKYPTEGFWIQGFWNETAFTWMFEDGIPMVYTNWRNPTLDSLPGFVFLYAPEYYKWISNNKFYPFMRGILCEILLT